MKIKDFATVVNGATPSSSHSEYYDGNIIWFTPKDLSNQNAKYISKGERTLTKEGFDSCSTKMLPANSLLMSSRAPIGLLAISKVECCTNQGFKSFIIDETKCDVEYLYYYLKHHIKEVEKLGSGTTFKEVSKEAIENYNVKLPSLKKQKQIVKILSVIDNKISLNELINRNLEELARLIYDYWFVQFDFPDKNGKPYKSSCGKMVWNGTLKREIPEGWQLKRIEDVCERIQSGGTPATSRKDLYDGSLNWFSTQELQDNFLFDSIKHISPNALKESSAKLFPKDTILIAIYAAPTVGRLGILTEDSAFNQACCGFVVNKETVSKEYLFLHLKQSRDKLNTLSGGTAQKNLNVGKMQNFEILVPPYEIMDLFTHQVGKMFDKMKQTSEESKNLTNLRDFLLPLLMNGQVSLRG